MSDIIFENEIPVKAGRAITIMVRFLAGDEYFCSTLLGYGGENFMNVENEERDMFEIKEVYRSKVPWKSVVFLEGAILFKDYIYIMTWKEHRVFKLDPE